MCETEAFINKQSDSTSNKTFSQDVENGALWTLAFWSNPTWIDPKQPLSTAALMQWVLYHRVSIALNKDTVADNIRNVKQVIPESKLAAYGHYRYNIGFEDMYYLAESLNLKCQTHKSDRYGRRYSFWSPDPSEAKTSIFSKECKSALKENAVYSCNNKRSLSEWLESLNSALIKIRRIADEAQLLDSSTESLLKLCLQFIRVAKINENMAKLLNSDIAFITDYEQLLAMPISKFELQSIPQPRENSRSDGEIADGLWMKLSSLKVRELWNNKDTTHSFPFGIVSQRNDHLIPLMKTNFLRRRGRNILDSTQENIDISENAEEVLGSLLQAMDETSNESRITSVATDGPKNYFPEAHGEWTKKLFPHRQDLKQATVRDSAFRRPRNVQPNSVEPSQEMEAEYIKMAMRYYRTAPPPSLPTAMSVPYIMYGQAQNKMMIMPATITNPNHPLQQVPFTPATNWYNNVYKYAAAAQVTPQPKMQDPRKMYLQNNSKSATETQYQLMSGEQSPTKNTAYKSGEEIHNEVVVVNNNEGRHVINNPLTQPNRKSNLQMIMPHSDRNIINNNISQTAAYRNYFQPVPSFVNRHLQKMPKTINYPLINYKPQTQSLLPSNRQILSEFPSNIRFHCATNTKQAQQRYFCQNQNCDNPLMNKQDTGLNYEEKVKKWLETVNKYVKSGSLEKLEESSNFDSYFKPDISEKGDSEQLEDYQNKNITDVLQNKSMRNTVTGSDILHSYGKKTEMRRQKKNANRLLFRHLPIFQSLLKRISKHTGFASKLKLMKHFFAEINLQNDKRCYSNHSSKSLKSKKASIRNNRQKPKGTQEVTQNPCSNYGIESDVQGSPSKSLFDLYEGSLLTNNDRDFKILIRESNMLLSKRMKLSNSLSLTFEREANTQDQQKSKVSSLKHYNAIIDDLFFSNDESANPDTVNGWAHFKAAVKSAVENIISSLDT